MLFFTCATKFHKVFIPFYVYFTKKTNPKARFEFLIDKKTQFLQKNEKILSYFQSQGINIKFRSIESLNYRPARDNSFRFLAQPETKSEFVFIGDVDILITENLLNYYINFFESNFNYVNLVRKDRERLSGLHCFKYDAHYPLVDEEKLCQTIEDDEKLLFSLLKSKGILIDMKEEKRLVDRVKELNNGKVVRRQHGIHISINRLPFFDQNVRADWGLTKQNLSVLAEIINHEDFQLFLESLNYSSTKFYHNLLLLYHFYKNLDQNKSQDILEPEINPSFEYLNHFFD